MASHVQVSKLEGIENRKKVLIDFLSLEIQRFVNSRHEQDPFGKYSN